MFRITRKADYAVFILSTLARRVESGNRPDEARGGIGARDAGDGGEVVGDRVVGNRLVGDQVNIDTAGGSGIGGSGIGGSGIGGNGRRSDGERRLESSGVDGDLVSAQALAEFSSLDKSLVANLLKDLTRAGFLTSVRGARGGYKLAMAADDITFEAILEAVEGPFTFVECAEQGDAGMVDADAGRNGNGVARGLSGDEVVADIGAGDENRPGLDCCNLLSLCSSQGALLYVHHRIRTLLREIKLTQLAGLDPSIAKRYAQELFPVPAAGASGPLRGASVEDKH